MACRLVGQRTFSGARDSEGHRSYKIKFRIDCDVTDGPANALQTPGLPVVGSWWVVRGDVDLWAWCRPDATMTPIGEEGLPVEHFDVEFMFSTKPPDKNKQRCNTTQIEDPLLEPQKVTGSFNKYTEEATVDAFGDPIVNSAWEQIRGPQVEFDANRASIKIEQNVLNLDFPTILQCKDTLNQFPLWGFPVRSIKMSAPPWERKFYGTCFEYFTRTFEFDIRLKEDPPNSGNWVGDWDRNILDEGTKVLNGHWGILAKDGTTGWVLDKIGGVEPDYNNPAHFIRFQDRNGENARVVLDGFGEPYDPNIPGTGSGVDQPGNIFVQKYLESDFLGLLNIPATF